MVLDSMTLSAKKNKKTKQNPFLDCYLLLLSPDSEHLAPSSGLKSYLIILIQHQLR